VVVLTILEPEGLYPDNSVEEPVLAGGARVVRGAAVAALDELPDALCEQADALMTLRMAVPAAQLARFPKLRVVVRMGVGYDRVDRAECARRGITLCNIPDYGTEEVADHAISLALGLRRGLFLHHETQRANPPAAWGVINTPLIRRLSVQRFAVLGLGRIGTAVALRAKAFGFDVVFFDPFLPNGVDRALGIRRVPSLAALMAQADVLSIHAPLTRKTRGLVGAAELALLPKGAVVVNTARGPIMDLEALEAGLRSGHIAGAGLDVVPVEPPVEPVPSLMRAYRAREDWLQGRLVITPHSAFHTPEAWDDIRLKGIETVRDVLVLGLQTNVIAPESD
jgi:C-terminal binding protein